MDEVWKPVPYAPFDRVYSVSSEGRVKPNVPRRYTGNRSVFLKPSLAGNRGRQYPCVTLHDGGRQKTHFIHKLVAVAFLGPPPFAGAMVCHKNDIRTDNRAENLMWGTAQQNADMREAGEKHSRGERNGYAKLTPQIVAEIRTLYARGDTTQMAIAERFGVSRPHVSEIVNGVYWPTMA